MKNLKIEYVNGQLATVEVEGIPMLDAGLSGLSLSHFLGKEPHLKFEVGGEIPEGLAPAQPQQPEPAQVVEDKPQPAETGPRHQRNRNKNRNRNHNRSH